ncbi:MAG TPA: hypothetical protein DDZ81_07865 [Acetobacteraceae bacterium]|jgi:hypothetical protein|nr:hypothetical protein [Acetobacteraceae bacterium]
MGELGDAFRPEGPSDPLDRKNRFLRLPTAFVPARGTGSHTNVYGEALWHGLFDASYTRPGDYLVVGAGTYFIASQAPLLPVLCVRTNRTISASRAGMQTNAALNGYGGYTPSARRMLMEKWPASVLGDGRSASSSAGLPTDQAAPIWDILLPSVAGVLLSPGDIVTDDLGRTAIIAGSELTNLGWRISAKMATT